MEQLISWMQLREETRQQQLVVHSIISPLQFDRSLHECVIHLEERSQLSWQRMHHLALSVDAEGLRSGEFNVLAGRDDADHGSSRAASKAAYDSIVGVGPSSKSASPNDEDPDPTIWTKHVRLNVPRTDRRAGSTNPRCR